MEGVRNSPFLTRLAYSGKCPQSELCALEETKAAGYTGCVYVLKIMSVDYFASFHWYLSVSAHIENST